MYKITLLESIHPAGIELLEASCELRRLTGANDPSLAEALADADAIIVRSTQIGANILDHAPNLRVIGRHGAGIDNIDQRLVQARGIRIVNTPRSNTESVAEYTIAAIMHLFKRFGAVEAALRTGTFDRAGGSLPGQVDRLGLSGREIAGAHLGLVGAGAIGQAVARRAIALGMKVSAVDPFADPAALRELGIAPVATIEALLPDVDAVSLHVPGDPARGPLLSARELDLLRADAVLVNAARGGLVDEDALASALSEGRLAGAAVDVYSTEPPHLDSPLFRAPHLMATPHMAAMTAEALERMAVDVARFTLDELRIATEDSAGATK